MSDGRTSLISFRRKKPERLGYPRLLATIAGYGDLIIRAEPHTPKEFRKLIVSGDVPEWIHATSPRHYGPTHILVRASSITAMWLQERPC